MCCLANARSSGSLAIVPSSFWISQMIPAGSHPARRARSTAASVCPARFNTPPSRARSGKMCPGRAKAEWVTFGSASARKVAARSAAEMPVLVPSRRSTDTVNAVRWLSVLWSTIIGRRNSSQRSPVSGATTTPEVWRMMNASFSGVTYCAAMMRSPSFSRSSSSTSTTISPRPIAAITSSIGANGSSRELFRGLMVAPCSSRGCGQIGQSAYPRRARSRLRRRHQIGRAHV